MKDMKRTLTTFFLLLLTCITVSAQQAELRRAVASRYKALNTYTATVKLTRHNAAVTKDAVTMGKYYWKRPSDQSMVFTSTKEMLLAVGNTYTMVKGGKSRAIKAKAQGNNPFEILSDIIAHLQTADNSAVLTTQANVAVTKQGTSYLLTVTPKTTDNKAKRRLMFTSFTVLVDKAGSISRLLIHERGNNYSQYDFSDYALNVNIDSKMFTTKACK